MRATTPLRALIIGGILILLPKLASASEPIDVRIDQASSPAIHVELLQVEPRMGRNIEVFLHIQNLSNERLERVELTIEQRRSDGRAVAFQSDVQEVGLAPGDEIYISRRTSTLRPRKGDTFVIAALPFDVSAAADEVARELLLKDGVSELFAISSCTTFCDKCSDRSVSLCGEGGVSEYECSCTETTAVCKIKCAP